MLVSIYTDGSSQRKPGWTGRIRNHFRVHVDSKGELHIKELSKGYEKTTNNRMELMAVIAGLEALNRPCDVKLYSDSKVCGRCIQSELDRRVAEERLKRGKNEPVKNVDLWKRLLEAKRATQCDIYLGEKDMMDILRMSDAMNSQLLRQMQ